MYQMQCLERKPTVTKKINKHSAVVAEVITIKIIIKN